MPRILLLALLAAAPFAQAETYKWVDERGVVNYSNTPPASGATPAVAQAVSDRVSTYQTDPQTNNAIEVYRRLDANQQEWLQRQQIMAMQAQAAPASSPAYNDYYYPPAYGYVNSRRIVRPVVFHAVRTNAPRAAPSASLRRF
ncbi:MAG: DUF4124 domain-containing protein [Betaproteobacteria bacterium]|nr:DUF4124 domain-containing protein [Betaproteobacteria bacterium]